MTSIDLAVARRDDGLYDFVLGSDGGLSTTSGLDSALVVSLLSNARADESEVHDPYRRQGWIGETVYPEIQRAFGSKLWLQSQARITNITLAKIKDAASKSLQWLVDDGYFRALTIRPVSVSNGVRLYVTMEADNRRTETVQYDIIRATGN